MDGIERGAVGPVVEQGAHDFGRAGEDREVQGRRVELGRPHRHERARSGEQEARRRTGVAVEAGRTQRPLAFAARERFLEPPRDGLATEEKDRGKVGAVRTGTGGEQHVQQPELQAQCLRDRRPDDEPQRRVELLLQVADSRRRALPNQQAGDLGDVLRQRVRVRGVLGDEPEQACRLGGIGEVPAREPPAGRRERAVQQVRPPAHGGGDARRVPREDGVGRQLVAAVEIVGDGHGAPRRGRRGPLRRRSAGDRRRLAVERHACPRRRTGSCRDPSRRSGSGRRSAPRTAARSARAGRRSRRSKWCAA